MVACGKKRDDQERVRLAVIGTGGIGEKHAKIATDLSGCRLVGICDVNSSVQSLADQIGVGFYSDFEKMIKVESPEGVIIATPTELHTQVGVTCARYGVHLFVEKPIAADLPDAWKLVESTRENDVRL